MLCASRMNISWWALGFLLAVNVSSLKMYFDVVLEKSSPIYKGDRSGYSLVAVENWECLRPSHLHWRIFKHCRLVNTDLCCGGICCLQLQACLDPEEGRSNLLQNVGNYLSFGTDLSLQDNILQAVETCPAFSLPNLKIYCRVHNWLPQDTVRSVPSLSVKYFFKIHFNTLILSTTKLSIFTHPFRCFD